MGGKAYLQRMPLGIPGAITRPRDCTIEPVSLDPANLFTSFGLAGKYVNNNFVPLAAGDDVSVVKGIFVRPFPIMSQTDIAYLGVTTSQVGDKLARGYICVKAPATAATAKRGDPVYVRVAAPTASSPLGSLLLTADATASNTPQLTKAEVMGPGDATGLVEIAYNI
ncbi:hypothetical protein AAIG33_24890 [Phytobacter ursingii]|uniref:structural cement protein Gp24 n=1 Tax=Phytobacter ursingii TaxID=1972431 RepID=UPI0031B77C23